ncbi:DUF4153 domain-containing protein [Sphingosinicella soli]|uniref:DUF4153 domain-containing protein n=1 Tax=Sphingosinicella soli TaxID=333708 RepID=A0A7W7F7G6_9SPHN|nr:DUF4153 domain-containing protein [Sphingosinicella soli]MBB4630623.1 hypothetical protein [Sphingosinicella soli]
MIDLGDGQRRHLVLMVAGALCGLAFWWLTHGSGPVGDIRTVAATGVCIAGAALAFTLSGVRPLWSAGFAAGCGAVAAGIVYWNLVAGPQADSSGSYDPWFAWQYLCLAAALGIALPVFQTVRDEGGWRLPYAGLHARSWEDIVVAIGAGGFQLAVTLLFALWASLFELIGVEFFSDVFEKPVFITVVGGASIALGISLVRDWPSVIAAMQKALMAVLSVFAPLLAFVLLLFLSFLPVTGLSKLWETTRHATPLMLGALLFALLLVNTVIKDANDQLSSARAMRFGATRLAFAMLPLAVIAAISTGIRVDASGLMPERIWAMIFTGFAIAYGLAYLWPLVRRFEGWADTVRTANVRLALALGVVFLLLSTPILDFRTISAENQAARLLSGKVAPDDFDFAALMFDLGAPGRDALGELADVEDHPQSEAIRHEIGQIYRTSSRWEARTRRAARETAPRLRQTFDRMPVYPSGKKLPEGLIAYLVESDDRPPTWLSGCGENENLLCAAVVADLTGDGLEDAVFISETCEIVSGSRTCWNDTDAYRQKADGWHAGLRPGDAYHSNTEGPIIKALKSGKLEIAPREGMELRVNGKLVAGAD